MKRNFIRLVKEEKDGKAIYDTYLTPSMIPLRKLYEAIDIEEESEKGNLSQRQLFDMMIDFVVSVYENQFTRDDVLDRLHAPDATEELQSQIQFVAQGQMDDERKKELKQMI